MSISRVVTRLGRVPLLTQVGFGKTVVDRRDFVVVDVVDASGALGRGCAYTRDLPLPALVHEVFAGAIIGLPVQEALSLPSGWLKAREFHAVDGGAIGRAAAVMELALLDLAALLEGRSVSHMLGDPGSPMTARLAAGYYRPGVGPRELGEELRAGVGQGYGGVKIMIGGASVEDDVERVRVARASVGNHPLAVDAAGSWSERVPPELLSCLEEAQVDLFEDPFPPRNVSAYAALAHHTNLRVGTGESLGDVGSFRQLLEAQALGLVRVDATVLPVTGALSEVSRLAADAGLPMFAHFFPHFHAQLSARLSDSWGVETVTPGVDGLSDLTEPVSVEGGRVVPQKNPGFGIGWHEDRLERWTVSALLA